MSNPEESPKAFGDPGARGVARWSANRPSRTALDSWLAKADVTLAGGQPTVAPPSSPADRQPLEDYETALTLLQLEAGLPDILCRLISDPGRWILIAHLGPADACYYVQFLVYEDGSLVAEAACNDFIGFRYRLSDVDHHRLAELGWEAPSSADRPNWIVVEPSTRPDVVALSRLAIETMRSAYRAGGRDVVGLTLFASTNRGPTPASEAG